MHSLSFDNSKNIYSKKIYKISILNEIQNINIKLPISKIKQIERIIKTTATKIHRPKIILNKNKFILE